MKNRKAGERFKSGDLKREEASVREAIRRLPLNERVVAAMELIFPRENAVDFIERKRNEKAGPPA